MKSSAVKSGPEYQMG